MADDEQPEGLNPAEFGYTAFEKWDYRPFIHVLKEEKGWIDFKQSFYRASEIIIDNLAKERGFPDVEGVAAVFLFRHYLELSLKGIIVRGRFLIHRNKNASREDVEEVVRIHNLAALWRLVLADAMPKFEKYVWDSYDIPFVEQCIMEFNERDERGFAFRYPRQGGERYEYEFRFFRQAMDHVFQILENITTYLIEMHGDNQDWEEIQNGF